MIVLKSDLTFHDIIHETSTDNTIIGGRCNTAVGVLLFGIHTVIVHGDEYQAFNNNGNAYFIFAGYTWIVLLLIMLAFGNSVAATVQSVPIQDQAFMA